MAEVKILNLADLPPGSKKTVAIEDTEILLVHLPSTTSQAAPTIVAVEAKCPHAGAPLEQAALCDDRLICPWHAATYSLPTGAWLDPPTLRSLQTYAVRLENDSIYVDPEPLTTPTVAHDTNTVTTPDDRHFVLLGAGAASATAACTLRQFGFGGRLTLVDPAEEEPVDRTNLSKMVLSGEMPLDSLPLWQPEDRAALHIERIRSSATALDPSAHTITLSNGGTLFYDSALIATGGTPAQLEIPGEDLPHVHTLRHVADVEAILNDVQRAQVSNGKQVAIIGDSFIALEAASALATTGLQVTVISRERLPFATQLGDAPAEALLALHRSKGVTLLTEAEAKAISPIAVTLKNGANVPANIVLVAIGIKPSTDFANAVAKNAKGLVEAANSCQVLPFLWAAGDVTSVNGVHIEHWRIAQQQGRTAALGMLTIESLPGVPYFWTYHFGKRLAYAGHAENWDELVIDGDLENLNFLAYYLQDGKVAAVLGCNQETALALLTEKLRQPLTLADARAAAAAAS
jgi:NADPH-dependent 2,4-dienoyl-CoA reductase/sulfur reductase-like enzyme/nitrite reductase/ring-hydroxylating ferredoxin subunit